MLEAKPTHRAESAQPLRQGETAGTNR